MGPLPRRARQPQALAAAAESPAARARARRGPPRTPSWARGGHYMTELKTCADPAPGSTGTHHPLHRATVIEKKGPLEAGFFRGDINTWYNS